MGPDLDSWMADYSFTRMPGSASLGQVTFSRYTPGIAVTIPVGVSLSTSNGSVSFAVVIDPTNSAWNGTSGYYMASTASSISLPLQATTTGSSGNVLPGAIGLLAVAIPGIDTVTNGAMFGGGLDAESDVSLRRRFQLYINSRSLATPLAIETAVASVQQGLRYVVLENTNPSGNVDSGNFWVVVDDGSGAPSSYLLANVSAAVDVVRPIGSTYSVTGPTIVNVAVQMTVVTSNPLTKPAVVAAIQVAVQNWITGLPVAGTLAVSKIEALAHDTDPSIVSVSSATINGASVDQVAPASGVIIASSG